MEKTEDSLPVDLLKREKFIGLLKDIVVQKSKDGNSGYSFAIDGKWGCGKSWILDKLENQLRDDGYLVIHYNCWENDYYEEPLVALLSVVIEAVEQCLSLKMKRGAKERIKTCLKFLKSVAEVVVEYKTGLNLAALNEAGIKASKEDREKVLPKKFDQNLPLKDAIDGIRDLLRSMKKDFPGILIAVDELDRCLPEYAIKVLERLHHICNGIPVVLLTVLNKDELSASISSVFGKRYNSEGVLNLVHRKLGTDYYSITGNLGMAKNTDALMKFADYYLLKFIQLVLPVPQTRLSVNPLAILNGFEYEFNQSSYQLNYVESFVRDVLGVLPMRDMESIVNHACTIHRIVKARAEVSEKISLGVLCVELIIALFQHQGQKSGVTLQFETEIESTRTSYFLSINGENEVNPSLRKWSESICFLHPMGRDAEVELYSCPLEDDHDFRHYIKILLLKDCSYNTKNAKYCFNNECQLRQEDIDFVGLLRSTLESLGEKL